MFLSKLPNVVVQMYLSKLPNVCICPNSQMFLSKFPNVLVQIANCICPNCQITKCVQCVQKNVRQKESRVGRMEGEGGRGGRHRLVLLQPPSLLPLPLSLCSTAGSVPALLSSPTLQKFLPQFRPNSVKLAKDGSFAPNLLFQRMLFSLSWLYKKLILSKINRADGNKICSSSLNTDTQEQSVCESQDCPPQPVHLS